MNEIRRTKGRERNGLDQHGLETLESASLFDCLPVSLFA